MLCGRAAGLRRRGEGRFHRPQARFADELCSLNVSRTFSNPLGFGARRDRDQVGTGDNRPAHAASVGVGGPAETATNEVRTIARRMRAKREASERPNRERIEPPFLSHASEAGGLTSRSLSSQNTDNQVLDPSAQ